MDHTYTTKEGVSCSFVECKYGPDKINNTGLLLKCITDSPQLPELFDIPSHVNGLPVVGIQKDSLMFSGFSSVIFPETLIMVPEGTFTYCSRIKEITIMSKNCDFQEKFENIYIPPTPRYGALEKMSVKINYRGGGLTEMCLKGKEIPDWLDIEFVRIKGKSKLREAVKEGYDR